MSAVIDREEVQNALKRAARAGVSGTTAERSGKFSGHEAVETVLLWRPVGPAELALIHASGMCEFPPRLPDQPIFYPVLSEAYAIGIARDWNVPRSGKGYVTRFRVRKKFLDGYEAKQVGGREHLEYWIPADDLPAFNRAIVGLIEVTAEFP